MDFDVFVAGFIMNGRLERIRWPRVKPNTIKRTIWLDFLCFFFFEPFVFPVGNSSSFGSVDDERWWDELAVRGY